MGKTLLEISKEIGVSTATISRVLNGETNVADETKTRVLEALERSGYTKRARRRSAELRNSGTVLIIAGQLHNPIILGFIDGIRQRLAEEGMRSVISLSDYDASVECDTLRYTAKNGFSGIFMLNAIENRKLVELISEIKTPIIFVNRYRCRYGRQLPLRLSCNGVSDRARTPPHRAYCGAAHVRDLP